RACPTGTVCDGGECVGECRAPAVECGGACVDTRVDPSHCGACGVGCESPDFGVGVCVEGNCTFQCVSPLYADCDGKAANGCETYLPADPAHCGACGQACPDYSALHRVAVCSSGACAPGACMEGYEDCNGQPADGCEIDLRSDPQNCGACGSDCQGRLCVEANCLPRRVLTTTELSAAVVRPDGKIRLWGNIAPGFGHREDVLDLGPVVNIDLVPGSGFVGLVAIRPDGTVATLNFRAPPANLDQVIKIATA